MIKLFELFNEFKGYEMINTGEIFGLFVGELPHASWYQSWIKKTDVVANTKEYEKFMTTLLEGIQVKFESNCISNEIDNWVTGTRGRAPKVITQRTVSGTVWKVEFYTFGQAGIKLSETITPYHIAKNLNGYYQVDRNQIYIKGKIPKNLQNILDTKKHSSRFDL